MKQLAEQNRRIILGCIGLLLLTGVGLVVFLVVGGVFHSALVTTGKPNAPERICNNLVAERLIEPEQCITDGSQTAYIPHYFPVGKVNFDYVSAGMMDFELLDFSKSNVCEGNREYVLAIYLTGTTDSVSFGFCDNILVSVGYSD